MDLYPAIDILGGRCVRLRQGDYAQETVYDDDPVAIAAAFVAAGARWVHVVDLDAARTGEPVNRQVIARIAEVAGESVRVQTGGGIRSVAAAEALWAVGVDRVVLGTAAIEQPDLVGALAGANSDRVAVGLDTRGGEVAVRGWVAGSGVSARDVLARLVGAGVAAVVVTDIGRDGMLAGPDVDGLQAVLDATDIEVIASGGVSSLGDLSTLAGLRGPTSGRPLSGAIVGKAIYEGRLTVGEAVAACAAFA